jgi:hypothetical protein
VLEVLERFASFDSEVAAVDELRRASAAGDGPGLTPGGGMGVSPLGLQAGTAVPREHVGGGAAL